MTQFEALEIVLHLASQNALDDEQVQDDPDLEDEQNLQEDALEIVSKMMEKMKVK